MPAPHGLVSDGFRALEAQGELGKADDRSANVLGHRHEKMTAFLALIVLALAFASIFTLFLGSPAPRGELLFSPPLGNFTGTTTVSTSFGYVCEASHMSAASVVAASSPPGRIGAGIEINCYPEYFGYLQVPLGPYQFPVWLVTFAVFGILSFYLSHKMLQKTPGAGEGM